MEMQESGGMGETKGGWDFNYSVRDIVIMAVLAAIGALVNAQGTGQIWFLANSSLGPLGGALLQGGFMWFYILGMWLIRKPGAALLIGAASSAIEVVGGNPSGIGTVGWGVSQGLAIEVVLAIANYARWGVLPAILAGAASSQFGTVWTAILFGWDPSFAGDVWLAVPVNLISGAILSGLLGYLLAQAIGRSGLVRAAAT